MARTVVITQSNYIPWRGYFDLIRQADELILLDSVQYTRRDWRNRNRIKTPGGPQWLTIPVGSKGAYAQTIDATAIFDPSWAESHVRALEQNYRRAANFDAVAPWLFDLLRQAAGRALLSQVNRFLLEALCPRLGIQVPIRFDREVLPDMDLTSIDASERLAVLASAVKASRYISGPAAQAYLDYRPFQQRGIAVQWMDYSGYRNYPQCWGVFIPNLSIVDLLLNCGDDAASYLSRDAAITNGQELA
ncbi:MAG: hypothetical protein BGN85_03465 [Alphaproteobacteria bacterium 64-11]|nr:WbqC family protein [Alphaproteobacteria bacterium]OJU10813.1 MAG: hypothetical protein BGN85_03465 [Alphaproteobacteria bacterium 64-11]